MDIECDNFETNLLAGHLRAKTYTNRGFSSVLSLWSVNIPSIGCRFCHPLQQRMFPSLRFRLAGIIGTSVPTNSPIDFTVGDLFDGIFPSLLRPDGYVFPSVQVCFTDGLFLSALPMDLFLSIHFRH